MTRRPSPIMRSRDDEGSILFALAAVITVTGLVVAVLATVAQSQTSTRRDRSFTTAVQGADAGVQQALFMANRGQALPSAASATPIAVGSAQVYWQATEVATTTGKEYLVRSSAYENGLERTITARLIQPPRFNIAAFADSNVEFRGGNDANSYRGQQTETGNGRVGSNGDLTFRGNADADGVDVYNYAADSSNRCSGNPCSRSELIDDRLDITSAAALAPLNAKLAACPHGTSAWVASQHGFRLDPPSSTPGDYHCFSSMTFDGNTTIGGTRDLPVVVYVTGNISLSNHISVNVGASLPLARTFQIYSTGGSVAIGNHSRIGGAIYAPNASCGGNPSNAQADVYGSIICRTIDNQGGWGFHFDDDLLSLGDGTWKVVNYSEDVTTAPVAPGTT